MGPTALLPLRGAEEFFALKNPAALARFEHANLGSKGQHATSRPPKPLLHLFTPWSRDLLEKLTGFQLIKKFPTFYGTQKFITVLTSACHLSLS
jgi:hypothetical protein